MIEIKIEHSQCKKGEPTSLGLMFEITAPKAPVVEITPRKTKAIVFVVDRSGSMDGGRLEMVKQTILETLPRLNSDDYISVVSFDDTPLTEVAMRKVSQHDMFQVRDTVARMQTGGSTNLEAGYQLGIEQANRVPRGVDTTLILLSDGHANRGATDPEVLGQMSARAVEHFITTSTIGIGTGYDERILDALAGRGNGNHIAAIELAEAVNALQAEIDDLLAKTMTDVRFEIEFGPEVSGRKARIRAARPMRKFETRYGSARALLGDLSSGEEKNVVFDLVLDSHALAQLGQVRGFQVKYTYFDVLADQTVSETRDFEIYLISPEDWTEPVRNEDIVAELRAVRLQAVRDRAIELYGQGREAEADELLKKAGLELQEVIANSMFMTDRNRARLYAQSDELSTFMGMQDINEKRKRLYESRNRIARDKGDFRAKP